MLIPIIFTGRWPGYGYIAGEAPDGLVTINSAPGVAIVDLFVRSTRAWVRSTRSTATGTYRFDGLEVAVLYDVVGRDLTQTYNDVIVARVTPVEYT